MGAISGFWNCAKLHSFCLYILATCGQLIFSTIDVPIIAKLYLLWNMEQKRFSFTEDLVSLLSWLLGFSCSYVATAWSMDLPSGPGTLHPIQVSKNLMVDPLVSLSICYAHRKKILQTSACDKQLLACEDQILLCPVPIVWDMCPCSLVPRPTF